MPLEKDDFINIVILGLIVTLIIVGAVGLGEVNIVISMANFWLILIAILSGIFIPHI